MCGIVVIIVAKLTIISSFMSLNIWVLYNFFKYLYNSKNQKFGAQCGQAWVCIFQIPLK